MIFCIQETQKNQNHRIENNIKRNPKLKKSKNSGLEVKDDQKNQRKALHILANEIIQLEEIKILNVYARNHGIPYFIKKTLINTNI